LGAGILRPRPPPIGERAVKRRDSNEPATLARIVRVEAVEMLPTYAEVLSHHAGNSPGGVALAYRAIEQALALLPDDPAPTDLTVETPFTGPGARDAIAYLTGRPPVIDPQLARPDLGPTRERFVFRVSYRATAVTLTVREGVVTGEFVELAGRPDRTEAQEERLTQLKEELARRALEAPEPFEAA
jgi:hypothetical protein